MRIVIDARWILPEISGIGLYTQELIRAFAAGAGEERFTLLFERPEVLERTRAECGLASHARIDCRLVPYGVFAPENQVRLPRLLRALRADVYHSTNYMMPLLGAGGAARVVTIHDLIPLLFPHYTPRALKTRFHTVFRAILRRVGRAADLIVAVSEATRRDILRELHVPPSRHDRVVVVPEGVLPGCRPSDAPRRGPPMILFVGRRDPYKNLPLLIEAFALLCRGGPDARLRVIGPEDTRYPEAEQAADRLGVRHRILWSGYLPPAELVRAYQEAWVFCLPSRYEGFGLTVLEAMACGAPVVCSDTSSLPEVVGDAGLRVPPDRADLLADALRRVLGDPALAEDLRARGLLRAAGFTWARAAAGTLAAYHRICPPAR